MHSSANPGQPAPNRTAYTILHEFLHSIGQNPDSTPGAYCGEGNCACYLMQECVASVFPLTIERCDNGKPRPRFSYGDYRQPPCKQK